MSGKPKRVQTMVSDEGRPCSREPCEVMYFCAASCISAQAMPESHALVMYFCAISTDKANV